MTVMKKWWLALVAPAMLSVGCLGGGDVESAQQPGSTELLEKEAALASAVFTGTVKDDRGAVVAGATVTINGISRTTDSAGKYFVSITATTAGYNLSASKAGYGPMSEFLAAGKLNGTHVLPRATIKAINAGVTSVVQAGDVTVTIPANSLVNAAGQVVTGTVNVSIAGYSPLRMPGDFTAVNSSGQRVALESVGAFSISAATAAGAEVNLGQNKTAEVVLRVPAEVKSMPPCVLSQSAAIPTCRIAMWRFDSTTGLWVEQQANIRPGSASTTFTLVGGPASQPGRPVQTNGGLGTWNADIEKKTPACTVIEISNFPSYCYNPAGVTPEPGISITAGLLNSAGTMLYRTSTIGSDSPFTVLYNISPNVNETVQLTFPSGAASDCAAFLSITSVPGGTSSNSPTGGTIQLNAGAPWGGTGFPKDTVSTPPQNVDLYDILDGTHPCHSSVKFEYSPL
ncbi:carboxypeptidase-like regulatory domain-containing protein [Stigmatella sp. ncwal1]|uniref:Carboxypeptidase-like regulatory domain-containing protein n=1 Tax=Stigmatella ashevillensis TaxID=2995309 RepID=A0ABT5D6T6_9BACT|nr:carboxypeptidase-like regulatory domain-containing protein [Stigmatella ashevillena]MDC0709361.1 carboxypeptidase-like regulatory domain-containing protein [Stigmatella ashevillena]